jgi:transposase
MQAYSSDLRLRVLADCDSGLGTKAVAEKYRVCPAIVRRWKQRRRETGEIGPRKRPGRPRRIDRSAVAAAVGDRPDATLRELRDALGLKCALQTLHGILRELGLSFKKKSSTRPSRTGRTLRPDASSGRRGRSGSTRGGWSSSTRLGPRPT